MAETRPPDHGERLRGLPLLGLLLLLVVLGYGDILGDFPLSDDFALMRVAFSASGLLDAAGLNHHDGPHFLRPVVKLVWWANYTIGGISPEPYHLVNLLFHVLNAWLVAWMVFGLTHHRFASWACAAAFAVYPIHPEAVTWLAGRVDVIAATGYLAALGFWVRFVTGTGRARYAVGAALCFTLAILAKEMAATLPITAAVIGICCRGRVTRKRLLLGLGLLAVVFAAYLGGRFALFGGLGGYHNTGGESIHLRADPRLAMQFVKQAGRQAVAPAVRDRHPDTFDPLRSVPLIAVGLAALITAAGGGLRRTVRQGMLALVLFVASLAPLLGWIELSSDGQSSRFLYLPSAFACVMLGAAFLARTDRLQQRIALAVLAAIWVGGYLVGLRDSNRPWRAAAHIARTIVDTAIERSQARPGIHKLVVTDLPDNHEGAYVFRNCIEQAVFLYHPDRKPVERLPRPAWETARKTADPAGRRHTLFLRWDAAAGGWREE